MKLNKSKYNILLMFERATELKPLYQEALDLSRLMLQLNQ